MKRATKLSRSEASAIRTLSNVAPVRVVEGRARGGCEKASVAGSNRARAEIIFFIAALTVLFLWVNWSAIVELVATWNREPDYSHGYLVAPIAAAFLWARRDRFPRASAVPGWGGFGLIGLSIVLFATGRQYFLNPFAFWAMIAWIGGAVWILGGRSVFWWALPSIGFLVFMVPLPYRMDGILSGPMQRVATYLSCWTLQLLGQPAFAEGNTIFLGDTQLEIEQACSGLRMLIMILALATAAAVLACRNWRERVFLACCVVPVALFANSMRIVSTGLAYQYVSEEASKAISHDVAGLIVIPIAAVTMGLALLYWRRLFVATDKAAVNVSRQKLDLLRDLNSSRDVT